MRESLKRKKDLLLFNKNENMHRINIISDYIHSLENVPKETLSFIKRADKELADVISLKMDKAIEYHKLFSVERTKMLFNEKKQLEEEINDFDKELFDIDRRLPSISETLKNTNEIKKLFSIQNQLFDKRKALMLANQSVLEVDNINREIELLKQNKKNNLSTIVMIWSKNYIQNFLPLSLILILLIIIKSIQQKYL